MDKEASYDLLPSHNEKTLNAMKAPRTVTRAMLTRGLLEVCSRTRRKHFSRSKILITKRGSTENKTKTSRNILPFITTLAPYN